MLEAEIALQKGDQRETVAVVPVPDGLAGFQVNNRKILVDGTSFRGVLRGSRVLGVSIDEEPIRGISVARVTGTGAQPRNKKETLVVRVK